MDTDLKIDFQVSINSWLILASKLERCQLEGDKFQRGNYAG
jgi:hypothetical protein